MSQLIKLGGAIFSCVGAVTGIAFSTNKEAVTPSLTQVSGDSEGSRVVKKEGYYVLADWGNGIQWRVKSDKLSNPDKLGDKGLGFKDVEMTIGDRKIKAGDKFITQLSRRDYVLYTISGNHYVLEGGQKLSPYELRNKWSDLGVTKYSDSPFNSQWRKFSYAPDYDFQFDTCRFDKVVGNKQINSDIKIRVVCQISRDDPWKLAWRGLTEKDYK